ncbi:MAG: hypothetical protein VB051_09530 [Candidatus Pelethousia sp.]|nr:hypothetical protein [Candidatus Pelethousia sp.]
MQGGGRGDDRRWRHLPLWKDPADSNIRIAPSLPPINELESALVVICTCLKLAVLEKLLGE